MTYENISWALYKAYEHFVEANNIVNKIFKEKFNKDKYVNVVNKHINFFSEFDLNKWSLELSDKKDPIIDCVQKKYVSTYFLDHFLCKIQRAHSFLPTGFPG